MLKDPAFDYNNDLALGRLLDTIAPAGKKAISEREQVKATIDCCVDDAATSAFLADRPILGKALAGKNHIRGVRVISLNDRQTQLTSQVAEHIYDLRCRIVHSKDSGDESVRPIRPFDRESHLMRHDLSLIRFVAPASPDRIKPSSLLVMTQAVAEYQRRRRGLLRSRSKWVSMY